MMFHGRVIHDPIVRNEQGELGHWSTWWRAAILRAGLDRNKWLEIQAVEYATFRCHKMLHKKTKFQRYLIVRLAFINSSWGFQSPWRSWHRYSESIGRFPSALTGFQNGLAELADKCIENHWEKVRWFSIYRLHPGILHPALNTFWDHILCRSVISLAGSDVCAEGSREGCFGGLPGQGLKAQAIFIQSYILVVEIIWYDEIICARLHVRFP